MADVELVIKIPEDDYESIKDDAKNFLSMPAHKVPSLYKAISDGTLLPKINGKTDYLKGITACLDIIDKYGEVKE